VWRAIVERLPGDLHQLRAFLDRAVPLEAKPGSVLLAFGPGEPFVSQVEREAALVERAASEHFGVPTKITLEKDSPRAAGIATLATLDAEEQERLRRVALAKVKNHPRVTDAVEVLGARVKDLKLAGQ
jgi:DNA polymerase-3 subunit gamma/tau